MKIDEERISKNARAEEKKTGHKRGERAGHGASPSDGALGAQLWFDLSIQLNLAQFSTLFNNAQTVKRLAPQQAFLVTAQLSFPASSTILQRPDFALHFYRDGCDLHPSQLHFIRGQAHEPASDHHIHTGTYVPIL